MPFRSHEEETGGFYPRHPAPGQAPAGFRGPASQSPADLNARRRCQGPRTCPRAPGSLETGGTSRPRPCGRRLSIPPVAAPDVFEAILRASPGPPPHPRAAACRAAAHSLVCCLSCILPVPIARHTRGRPCRRLHDPPVRFRRTAAAACAGRARRTSRVTHHSCPLPPPFRGWGVILVSATLLSRSRSDVRDTRNDRRAKGPRKKPLVAARFFLPAVQALSKPGGRGEMWRRRDPPATAA